MRQHLTRPKKILNNKVSWRAPMRYEPKSCFYLFLKNKRWDFFIKNKNQKNKTKNFYKNITKNYIKLLKSLKVVYIEFIKQNILNIFRVLLKIVVQRTCVFLKNLGFLTTNNNNILIPKTNLKTHQYEQ